MEARVGRLVCQMAARPPCSPSRPRTVTKGMFALRFSSSARGPQKRCLLDSRGQQASARPHHLCCGELLIEFTSPEKPVPRGTAEIEWQKRQFTLFHWHSILPWLLLGPFFQRTGSSPAGWFADFYGLYVTHGYQEDTPSSVTGCSHLLRSDFVHLSLLVAPDLSLCFVLVSLS